MFHKLARKYPTPVMPIIMLIIGFVLASASLYLFITLADEVLDKQKIAFDQIVIGYISSFRSTGVTKVMLFFTNLGSKITISVLLIISLLWLALKKKNIAGAVVFLVCVAGGGLLNVFLKDRFVRLRRLHGMIKEIGYSFPSGHAMGNLIFYGFLGYLIVKSQRSRLSRTIWIIVFIILVLFIGISRIYLGVHYPSDVAAGYSAGTLWLFVCIAAFEGFLAYRKRHRHS